ncbi:MAG: CTAG/PCC1 family protein [Nitrosopumilaceae archaeon]
MKAAIELSFASAQDAHKALKALKQKELNSKSKITLRCKENKITAKIEAERFALLRARTSGFLRNAKIVFDVIGLVQSEKKKNVHKK